MTNSEIIFDNKLKLVVTKIMYLFNLLMYDAFMLCL